MLRNCWVICFCIGRPCNNGKTDIRQTASNHIRSVGYRNVDETQGQKPRPRMSARLPALFRNDLIIFRGEWNLFADYFVSLQRNFNEFLMRREINYVNAEQKVAQILGHSKDLITLSLSLSLRRSPTIVYTLLRGAGTRVKIYGFSWNKPREAALFFKTFIHININP